jgi:hypothetical protein
VAKQSFTLVALIAGKPQTPERLGDTLGPAGLLPVFWLCQWNREGPRARSRVRLQVVGEKRA